MCEIEKILKAFRWRLGIPVDADASAQSTWDTMTKGKSRAGYQKCTAAVAESLGSLLADAIRHKLDPVARSPEHHGHSQALESLWTDFAKWLMANEMTRSPVVSARIREALQRALNHPIKTNATEKPTLIRGRGGLTGTHKSPPAPVANPFKVPARLGRAPGSPRVAPVPTSSLAGNQPVTGARPQVTVLEARNSEEQQDQTKDGNMHDLDAGQPPQGGTRQSLWKYVPVPDGPDGHDEYEARAMPAPGDIRILGARIRGRKHKHEGTNCDDWFEIASSGPWNIIAVSDGAGSKSLSRVGAEVACKAAVACLSGQLKDHRLDRRETWTSQTLQRDPATSAFAELDLQYVQTALHLAMRKAHEAVAAAAQARADGEEYRNLLGRPPEVNDLSCTLLLAVQITVLFQGRNYSFAMACQVGDGMAAAVTSAGDLQLLGIPDSGEFSGETEFLTSKGKLESASLAAKTIPLFAPLGALIVMTDGVADDYFPSDPGLLRLYADLVLNGIVPPERIKDEEMKTALLQTPLGDMAGAAAAMAASADKVERLLGVEQTEQVLLYSAPAYADKLGVAAESLPKMAALLAAGSRSVPTSGRQATPEGRLEAWLDGYQVRGSFDDRTLVVLHTEKMP